MASYKRRGDGWWIRWRERKPDGGWRSRSLTLQGSERDAEAKVIEVERELEETGTVREAAASSAPPASLLDGMLALIDARVRQGRWSGSTPATYHSYVIALARAIHQVTGLPTSEPIPVTELNRSLFDQVLAQWRKDGRSQSATYAAMRLLLEAWRWMADDPRRWPGVPPAPRLSKDYLPQTPGYARTEAPSMAHVDAMLRRLSRRGQHPETVLFAVFARYLGWRGRQVYGLMLEHVDLDAMTLVVDVGKSRRERLERRVVPLPKNLLQESGVRELLTRADSGPVFRGRGVDGVKRARRWLPDASLSTAWEMASELDQVPVHVWNPPQRKYARPVHALRAAYQAHLEDLGAPADVIDYLVGHAPKTTRAAHYGRAMVDAAREWVDQLPRVKWRTRVLRLSDAG